MTIEEAEQTQMSSKELAALILNDHYRIYKNKKKSSVFKHLFIAESFKYIFWMRVCSYLKRKNIKIPYYGCKLILNHYKYKFGICIPCQTDIGKGFYIGHFGGIIVSPESKIGEHCNISQGVTIGKISQGEKQGAPTIGNRVYIGPGAKIIGNITIGDNVAIGANAVVINDVLSDCTIGGIPAKIISTNNSSLYINNISN